MTNGSRQSSPEIEGEVSLTEVSKPEDEQKREPFMPGSQNVKRLESNVSSGILDKADLPNNGLECGKRGKRGIGILKANRKGASLLKLRRVWKLLRDKYVG